MPTFRYIAQETGGARVSGTLSATTEHAVLDQLESRRLLPLEIKPIKAKAARGIKARKLAGGYTQLSDLLGAGVPLMRSLEILARQKSDPKLAGVMGQVAKDVADGQEVATAMEQHAGVFPTVHLAMVRAGERGGFIESVFERLGELVEAQAELQDKIRGSLIYPAFVIGVGTVIVTAIFLIFVPRFELLIEQRLDDIPTITKVVFATGNLVTGAWWLLPLLLVGGYGLYRYAMQEAAWRERLAKFRSALPVVGSLTRDIAVARFCRLLGTMESNGVPLLKAMAIAREAAGEPQLERAIDEAIDAVSKGATIAEPLAKSGLFGDDVVEMISVGEASGTVDTVLLRLADTLEQRVSRRLSVAVELIGPMALLILGITIALIAVGLILPLMQLTSSA